MTDSQDPSADSARQQRLRFVFREIDFDGTGNVYTAELLELLSPRLTFRGAWTDELNNEVVEQLDGDGHLKVDADLFVSAYAVALPAEVQMLRRHQFSLVPRNDTTAPASPPRSNWLLCGQHRRQLARSNGLL